MEQAMKQSEIRFAAGQIVKGTVIEVHPREVLVDIGYKSEGVIPAAEFESIAAVKVGDEVNVLIERLEDRDGMIVLSKEKADFKQNWEKILSACNEGGTVTGSARLRHFAAANLDGLARDMAAGEGEVLAAFASLKGVAEPDRPAFYAFAQAHFGEIFAGDDVTELDVLAALDRLLAQDAQLAAYARS